MFVDTHAHIYVEEFESDLDQVLSQAQSVGVSKIFMPNIDEPSLPKMIAVSQKYPYCYPMLGLHPCHVFDDYKNVISNMWQNFDVNTYTAIGEIGIDLYWDKTMYDQQIDAFRWQISLAKEAGLPFVIHSREALDLTISIVQEMQDGSLSGIFHCFGGDIVQAHKIIDLGFYLGIGGVVTYKNSGLDKVLPEVSLSNIVLETDSPYLSPVPYRGKRNEPAHILPIAERIAHIKKTSLDIVGKETTANALSLFRLENRE